MADKPIIGFGGVAGVILAIGLPIGLGLWGCPTYNVYAAHMAGEAELAQADQNRQIAVRVAQAKADAAVLEAQAEVARAKGVAQANAIIGESLKGNEAYLRYLWINGLENNKNAVIYVPTETNLPILEAGHRPLGQP